MSSAPPMLTMPVMLLLAAPLFGQVEVPEAPIEGRDYVVYEADGDPASLADIMSTFDDASVVLVGEQHDDMVGHGVQLELLRAATARVLEADARGRAVVLSLEMFERDVQYIVDEYLAGLITEDHFLRSARPWDFYDLRYRPMVEFAKDRGLPVIAANAPRRYVNRVTREGPTSLEVLGRKAREVLPPLPYPGPSDAYRAEWDALMSAAMAAMTPEPDSADSASDSEAAPQHMPASNAIYSQALWDASMGHAITTMLDAEPEALVLHMAGSFHVQNGTGIAERVEDYRPGTRLRTVVMVSVEDVSSFDEDEHADLGDFVVLTRKPDDAADGAS